MVDPCRHLVNWMPRKFHPVVLSVSSLMEALSQLFELVANCHLFDQQGQYSADIHLQNMIEYLGEFPLQFLEACDRRDEYFDANGES